MINYLNTCAMKGIYIDTYSSVFIRTKAAQSKDKQTKTMISILYISNLK